MWLAMHEPEKAQELLGREKGYVTFEEIGMCQTKEGIKFDIDYRILENAKKLMEKTDEKLKNLIVLYALMKVKIQDLEIEDLSNENEGYDFEEDNNSLRLVTISYYEQHDFPGMCDPSSCNVDEEICEVNLDS